MNRHTTQDCIAELQSQSLRVTPARLGILAALESASKPFDVSQIAAYLKKRRIRADKVTVFRILHAFTKSGLVKPIELNEGKTRYEHAGRSDHHHFVCEQCGDIQDVESCTVQQLEKSLSRKKGVFVRRHSLEFFGLCADCNT